MSGIVVVVQEFLILIDLMFLLLMSYFFHLEKDSLRFFDEYLTIFMIDLLDFQFMTCMEDSGPQLV